MDLPTTPIIKTSKQIQISPVKTWSQKQLFDPDNFQNFIQAQTFTTPTKKSRRRTFDFSSDSKIKNQIINLSKNDVYECIQSQKFENITSYFSDKAKQLRFYQILHTHYVYTRNYDPSSQNSKSRIIQVNSRIFQNHNKKLIESQKEYIDLSEYIKKIKKIYPYTSSSRIVHKIEQICLNNLTSPLTRPMSVKDYSLKKLKHLQSLNLIEYQQEQYNLGKVLSSENQIQFQFQNKQIQQDILLLEDNIIEGTPQNYCEIITKQGVYFCQWQIVQSYLKLTSKQMRPGYQKIQYLIYGSPQDNLIKRSYEQYLFFGDIQEIMFRKFCQIMYNSIQIFIKNGKSKFLNFYTPSLLNSFINKIQKKFKNIKIIKDLVKQFNNGNFTQKWSQGYMSNFDYLMILNKYSGRSLNDITQYYVFPWVIQDYKSQKLDLNDPHIFRNLDKPIGALNPQKLKRYKQMYKNNRQTHFYGSHYSTSLFILYYLVRLEPFSTLHREMQRGTFDIADRLFSSIQLVWQSLMSQTSSTDIKQLIPQFYYMPAILKNVGNIQFGQKACGQQVNDVVLPLWASSATQFTLTLRAALESDYVSENLHSWIDLIFGKHQSSEQKYNIFLQLSYSQKINWKQIKNNLNILQGTISQINYYGQCPIKLFSKQHKSKKILVQQKINSAIRTLSTQNSYSDIQQTNIMQGWKLCKIYKQNQLFYIQVSNANNQKQIFYTIIDPNCNFADLKQKLDDLKPINMKKKQQLKIKIVQKSISLYKNQLRINNQIVLQISVNFQFLKIQVNDLWLCCYGPKGLRIYNWQLQVQYKWEKQQVINVHLEPTRIIFATPTGKLCFYSFFSKKHQQIQVLKNVKQMIMNVMMLARIPSKQNRNIINYRILCIGNRKKVSLIQYAFQQSQNYTSSMVH